MCLESQIITALILESIWKRVSRLPSFRFVPGTLARRKHLLPIWLRSVASGEERSLFSLVKWLYSHCGVHFHSEKVFCLTKIEINIFVAATIHRPRSRIRWKVKQPCLLYLTYATTFQRYLPGNCRSLFCAYLWGSAKDALSLWQARNSAVGVFNISWLPWRPSKALYCTEE